MTQQNNASFIMQVRHMRSSTKRMAVLRKIALTLAVGIPLACFALLPAAHAGDNAPPALEYRHRLIEAVERDGVDSVPELSEALGHESEIVRMTAARLLLLIGEDAQAGFRAALDSPDDAVRRKIIRGLGDRNLVDDYWTQILMDDAPAIGRLVRNILLKEHPLPRGEELDRLVDELTEIYDGAQESRRRHVVEMLASLDDLPPGARHILFVAADDDVESIRHSAYQAALKNIEPDWDEAAEVLAAALADPSENIREIGLEMRWKLLEVEQVRMPEEGWRFKTDPDDVGREAGWYAPDFDDGDWRTDVPIEDSWQNHMDRAYNGVAWYRLSLDIPDVPRGDRVYLHFEGVDEEAWVWLNGKFVGEHTMGPDGWDVPFLLDATEAVEMGEENRIAVRARNTRMGAGIWRPVRLRVLDSTILD